MRNLETGEQRNTDKNRLQDDESFRQANEKNHFVKLFK